MLRELDLWVQKGRWRKLLPRARGLIATVCLLSLGLSARNPCQSDLALPIILKGNWPIPNTVYVR